MKSSRLTMSSESNITIPPEIITDILYRLPAKSLGRFKCVSKNWLSLISDPQFIKTHQTTQNRKHIMFISNDDSLYSLPLHHHKPVLTPEKLRFESDHVNFPCGSCNGLVLAYSYNSSDGVHSLVVLNPTTREIAELPKSHYEVIRNLSIIDIMHGFGYDSLTDDYKVVTICKYFHHYHVVFPESNPVHVYSLRTNTWRWVTDSPYKFTYPQRVSGVFVDGFLHWIARKGSDLLPVIVGFSLADEAFIELPSPNDVDIMTWNHCKLVVLGGKLAIFFHGEVWLMNQYGVKESWIKISIHGVDDGIPSIDQTLIYGARSLNTFENLKVSRVCGTYVESLVSPKLSNLKMRNNKRVQFSANKVREWRWHQRSNKIRS